MTTLKYKSFSQVNNSNRTKKETMQDFKKRTGVIHLELTPLSWLGDEHNNKASLYMGPLVAGVIPLQACRQQVHLQVAIMGNIVYNVSQHSKPRHEPC